MEQGDFDVSKQFYNYVLEKEECPEHGVVIPIDLLKTQELAELLMIWTVPTLGCTCNPYFTLKILARAL